MLNVYLLLGGFVLVVAMAVVVAVIATRAANSTDGERRLRTRMQGPFVPLSEEDIAEDDARARQRRRGRIDGEP